MFQYLKKALKMTMKILLDQYNGERLKLEGRIEALKDLKSDLKVQNKDKDNIQAKIQKITGDIEEAEAEYKSLQDKNDVLNSKKSDFETTSSALESRKNLVERMEADEKYLRIKLDEIEATEKRINELKPKIDKLPVLKGMQDAKDELKGLKKEEALLNKIIHEVKKKK